MPKFEYRDSVSHKAEEETKSTKTGEENQLD